MTIKIIAPDASLTFIPHFLPLAQSRVLLASFSQQLAWQQDTLPMYGKQVAIPRLQAWYSDTGIDYGYSGIRLQPNCWLPELLQLKTQLEQACQHTFNAVLANLYRNGNDTVGWHSDDEPELGINPVIASISLGDSRDFQMKHKVTSEKLTIPLTCGSLLIMSGTTQRYWQHCLPRTKRVKSPRINLTFRQILT